MITNVEYWPFGDDVKCAVDMQHENVYFQIQMIFDYKDQTYVIVQETLDDFAYPALLQYTEDHTVFYIVPIMDESLYQELVSAIIEYQKQQHIN
jgi:hypothetical protein